MVERVTAKNTRRCSGAALRAGTAARGRGEPTSEPDGPSTEGHNKLPGKQGWSRKPGKSGKDRKSSKDRKDRRPADDEDAPRGEDRRERDANRPSPRKPSSEERSRLPGAPAEDDHE